MLTIRLDSTLSIGDQIHCGLRRLIASRELTPGDELPPVRQLAADLGVNLNTVARAYRALEQDGLVTSVRGRGTHICSDIVRNEQSRATAAGRVTDSLRPVLADAKLFGLDRNETERLVDAVLHEYWPTSTK